MDPSRGSRGPAWFVWRGADPAKPATGWDNDGINFGLGAAIGTWRLGYAVVPFDSDLGSTHRFSVGFRL